MVTRGRGGQCGQAGEGRWEGLAGGLQAAGMGAGAGRGPAVGGEQGDSGADTSAVLPVTSQQGQRPQTLTSRRLPASSCSSEGRWVAWATEEGTVRWQGLRGRPASGPLEWTLEGSAQGPPLSLPLSTQPAWDRAGPLECLLLGPEFSVD